MYATDENRIPKKMFGTAIENNCITKSYARISISGYTHFVPAGRWDGIKRVYGPEIVRQLRSGVEIEYTLATNGANRLWKLLHTEPYINSLGAITGNQAMQMVRAGLNAIYMSGWQIAADGNTAGSMYPDQSLYPSNSGPEMVRRVNKTLERASQIENAEGNLSRDWFVPIVADAEAGFGGPLNCFEIMKAYIEAGAAGVHFEDQLASEKKCGHLGGKVLIPTNAHVRNLSAARLAADVCGVPTVIISRTDAESATLLTSNIDERDCEFIDTLAGRTAEGFFRLKQGSGLQHCIKRGLSAAPYSDLLWWETSTPNMEHAKVFAEAIQKEFPGKMMAYNCSPSFNWRANLSPEAIAKFQAELGAMGYKFQFVTLAGFHSINYGMFELSRKYKDYGMSAYSELQQAEFKSEPHGYTAVRHQREVGTGYFDTVMLAVTDDREVTHENLLGGKSSTLALSESTEAAQFTKEAEPIPYGLPQISVQPATEPAIARAAMQMKQNVSQDSSVQLTMDLEEGDEKVISTETIQFLASLHRRFEKKRQQILEARKTRQLLLNAGQRPKFLTTTGDIKKTNWKILGTPKDLQDRQVEITGPCDRKMVINALNSGAKTYMADFEDSTTPTWRNLIEGQKNLYDAIRGEISFEDAQSGKQYKVGPKPAVLMVRPRGWHLPELHVQIDGEPMSGSLFDFGVYVFNNARKLLGNGTGPYFYLPKMENYHEAELWNEVLNAAEDYLKIPRGTIKVTVLVEHILLTYEIDEVLYSLRDHIVGLNCGRWDYIFSYIKAFQNHRGFLTPNRSEIRMTTPFMRNYSRSVIKACHQRGAHAMGGMAAQIPIKSNAEENTKALQAVREDKVREANEGHDGTWVAHPGLVGIAIEAFAATLNGKPNQVDRLRPDVNPSAASLIEIPLGSRTEAGLRHNINVTLGYLEAWLRGTGCVPLYNLMEDAATAEISRSQIWQWVHHNAQLDDGRTVDLNMVENVINEEKAKWITKLQSHNRLDDATNLLFKFVSDKNLKDFLTLDAYKKLVQEGH
ncbi:unnamed protein product [Adineta ricciae]|uniref:Malate synthase n=1 Tax=Adineta ricciae TaxID=249248 RepID=A0A815PVF3_ADIRI|nr:unnamed protein product [Adineta ricciae]